MPRIVTSNTRFTWSAGDVGRIEETVQELMRRTGEKEWDVYSRMINVAMVYMHALVSGIAFVLRPGSRVSGQTGATSLMQVSGDTSIPRNVARQSCNSS